MKRNTYRANIETLLVRLAAKDTTNSSRLCRVSNRGTSTVALYKRSLAHIANLCNLISSSYHSHVSFHARLRKIRLFAIAADSGGSDDGANGATVMESIG